MCWPSCQSGNSVKLIAEPLDFAGCQITVVTVLHLNHKYTINKSFSSELFSIQMNCFVKTLPDLRAKECA